MAPAEESTSQMYIAMTETGRGNRVQMWTQKKSTMTFMTSKGKWQISLDGEASVSRDNPCGLDRRVEYFIDRMTDTEPGLVEVLDNQCSQVLHAHAKGRGGKTARLKALYGLSHFVPGLRGHHFRQSGRPENDPSIPGHNVVGI